MAYMSSVRYTVNLLKHKHFSSPAISTKVCDGVSIGFRLSLCHIQRPWLVPHNVDDVKRRVQQRFPNEPGSLFGLVTKHMLFEGSMLNNYTMITSAAIRDIVWKLAQPRDSGISIKQHEALVAWLSNHKNLIPYIKMTKASEVCSIHSSFVGSVCLLYCQMCISHAMICICSIPQPDYCVFGTEGRSFSLGSRCEANQACYCPLGMC